jgi:hypothetical protein
MFVGGCSTLKPDQLPDEYTLPPSDAPIWQSLVEIRSDNWFVLLNDGVDYRISDGSNSGKLFHARLPKVHETSDFLYS